MAVYSPEDAKVIIKVQSGTDSGGKPILKTVSFSKCINTVTADKVSAFSAAVAPLVEYTVRATYLQRMDSVEAA